MMVNRFGTKKSVLSRQARARRKRFGIGEFAIIKKKKVFF